MSTQHPRWLIDDTAGVSDARVFVAHMADPRFVGELVPEAEAQMIGGITLSAPLGQVVHRIVWFDDPVFDAEELLASLAAALAHHDVVRGA